MLSDMAGLVTALHWRDNFIIEVAEEGFYCVVPLVDEDGKFAHCVDACIAIHDLRELVACLGKEWIVHKDGFS